MASAVYECATHVLNSPTVCFLDCTIIVRQCCSIPPLYDRLSSSSQLFLLEARGAICIWYRLGPLITSCILWMGAQYIFMFALAPWFFQKSMLSRYGGVYVAFYTRLDFDFSIFITGWTICLLSGLIPRCFRICKAPSPIIKPWPISLGFQDVPLYNLMSNDASNRSSYLHVFHAFPGVTEEWSQL